MTTIKEIPFDELVELLWEVDSFLSGWGVSKPPLVVRRHLEAMTSDKAGRPLGKAGFPEGETLVPVGVALHVNGLYVRMRHAVEGSYGYEYVDVTAAQLDDKFDHFLYDQVSKMVAGSEMAVGLGDLFMRTSMRINRKPALQEALLKKLARAQDIRASAKSDAEKKAVQDFYKDENYGAF